jgi:alkanesulfonate monooxygenase SsuD/methylene tetrahydromethanopterin reductase-like flavin-dependent oxidoreductase (luciferase family)
VRERVGRLRGCCTRLREAGMRTWVGGHSAPVRATAAAAADGWNGWSTGRDDFAAGADDVRARAAAAGRHVEITWGGQVLIARNSAAAAAKLKRHGTRPGLVHGTVDDLRDHFTALEASGVSWAVCALLDADSSADAVEMVAEARDTRR